MHGLTLWFASWPVYSQVLGPTLYIILRDQRANTANYIETSLIRAPCIGIRGCP